MGYKVEKRKGEGELGLVKEKVVLLVRMVEVVQQMELLMVEIEVVKGNQRGLGCVHLDEMECVHLDEME